MKKYIALYLLICCFALPVRAEFDADYIGELKLYRAAFEDTFVRLARDNNLGFVELRAANPTLDPWIPGEGAEILLPSQHLLPDTPREGITINLPEMRIFYYPPEGGAPYSFPIGIGRDGFDTPLGRTTVVRKAEHPTWRPTARMREEDPELPASVPPGPDNPLGSHALYLGWPAYLVHGTNKPYGIGRRVSSGCIRLYPEHISELYELVPRGTPVHVVNQPVKAGWIDDSFYIEAHAVMEEADFLEVSGAIETTRLSSEDVANILEVAGDFGNHLDWPKIRQVVAERRGYPVRIGTSPQKQGPRQQDTSTIEKIEIEDMAEKPETDEAPDNSEDPAGRRQANISEAREISRNLN